PEQFHGGPQRLEGAWLAAHAPIIASAGRIDLSPRLPRETLRTIFSHRGERRLRRSNMRKSVLMLVAIASFATVDFQGQAEVARPLRLQQFAPVLNRATA